MASQYTVKVSSQFSAAHTLRDYVGPCERMHGHNFKIEVELTASELDKTGFVIDFREIRQGLKQLTDMLDHQYINEIEPFTTINPTAENLSCWFYQEMSRLLNRERVRVSAVIVWETDYAWARYSEDSNEHH